VTPPERAGAASAISETSAELGGALGVAVLGSVGAFMYRRIMISYALDASLGEHAAAAQATIGGAVAVAHRLPIDVANGILGPAREAFTYTLHATAAISCAILLMTALLSRTTLRVERRDV
jgi:DHA2 family multidrug resistance protein-like MFS transporter